jgi:hypothetical protein
VRVDRHSVLDGSDADLLQSDVLNARTAASGDEQSIAAKFASVVELQNVIVTLATSLYCSHLERHINSVLAQGIAERLAQRSRRTWKQLR